MSNSPLIVNPTKVRTLKAIHNLSSITVVCLIIVNPTKVRTLKAIHNPTSPRVVLFVIVNPTKLRTLLTAGMFLGEFVNLVPRFESKGVYIELERSGNQRIQIKQTL
jgi:hypothetical protein